MSVREDVNEQQDVRVAREDEVDKLLTSRLGKDTSNTAATLLEGSEGDSVDNGRNVLNNSHGANDKDSDANAQETDDRSRPSFEINELLAQRFGSIRR